jgi:segregation and condensation protein A
MSNYTIQLPNFEGPLDLLLYFIRRDELNIYDIPIAKITGDFLDYVRLMEMFDLELAGEFMVMAASLMQIKALMLLPREKVNADGEVEEIDPRAELLNRLLIYKQFKEAAGDLSERAEKERYHYYRTFFDAENQHLGSNDALKNTTLFDLMRALKKALDRNLDAQKHYDVERRQLTVEHRVEEIENLMKEHKQLSFFHLVQQQSRKMIVVTFLALLEMVKQKLISISQDNAGGEDDIIVGEFVEVPDIDDSPAPGIA